MARWLVIQLDGRERRVPKSVALLAVRRNEASQPDPQKRIIFERTRVHSSDPGRFNTSVLPIVVVDPMDSVKRGFVESQGLLVRYPIKDQRSKQASARKLGRTVIRASSGTPKPGSKAQRNAGDRL